MIYELKGERPIIGKNCYIAPNATLVGDITLGDSVSIWFGAVIRGDMSSITIGDMSNIQDNVTLHGDTPYEIKIGKGVTIGHNAIVHGAIVEDNSIIGMGAILLNGSKIPKNCIVGAGAIVSPKLEVEEGSLIVGSPARVARKLTKENIEYLKYAKDVYLKDIEIYTSELKEIK